MGVSETVQTVIARTQGEIVRKSWKKKTKQRKNEQSTMEEVEIFEEFVVLEDNQENPCACVRVYKWYFVTKIVLIHCEKKLF